MKDPKVVKVCIATRRRPDTNEVDIGVTAMIEEDIVVAAWAMHERSYNWLQQLDEAEAIKLAMSKLATKRWRKIIVQSSNKQLL